MAKSQPSLAAGAKANGFVNRRSTVQSRPPAQETQRNREFDLKRRSDRSAAFERAEVLEATFRLAGALLRGAA